MPFPNVDSVKLGCRVFAGVLIIKHRGRAVEIWKWACGGEEIWIYTPASFIHEGARDYRRPGAEEYDVHFLFEFRQCELRARKEFNCVLLGFVIGCKRHLCFFLGAWEQWRAAFLRALNTAVIWCFSRHLAVMDVIGTRCGHSVIFQFFDVFFSRNCVGIYKLRSQYFSLIFIIHKQLKQLLWSSFF